MNETTEELETVLQAAHAKPLRNLNDVEWGTVEVEGTPGPEGRDTNALESLLALCRMMGLKYRVTATDPQWSFASYAPWQAQVRMQQHWATDFFEPRKRGRACGRYGKTPTDALRAAMSDAVMELARNAGHYRSGFWEYWERETGHPWAPANNEVIVLLSILPDRLLGIDRAKPIAQLIIEKVSTPDVLEVEYLGETERGTGGFGSTDNSR